MEELNGKDKELEAFRLCQEFLGKPWSEVTLCYFNISSVSGGFSNDLYCCSISNHVVISNPNIPRKVLLRLYGPMQEDEHSKATETAIFAILSERKLGPRLYGVFSKGRIEEYIPSRHFLAEDLGLKSVSVARAMAKIHALDLPLRKTLDLWFNHMERWIHDIEKHNAKNGYKKSYFLGSIFREEMKFLSQEILKFESPSVFCHNDLSAGNILLPEGSANDDVMLIDFEFGGYNYRAFDIANHFCHWILDFEVSEPPFVKLDCTKYPTKEERIKFIQAYVKQLVLEGVLKHSETEEEVEKILLEIKFFRLVALLYWSLWGEKNKDDEKSGVFHQETLRIRQDLYWKLKDKYLKDKLLKK